MNTLTYLHDANKQTVFYLEVTVDDSDYCRHFRMLTENESFGHNVDQRCSHVLTQE